MSVTDYPCPNCGRRIPVNEDTCECGTFTGPQEPIKAKRHLEERPKPRLKNRRRPRR